jgi:hypothetical protein
VLVTWCYALEFIHERFVLCEDELARIHTAINGEVALGKLIQKRTTAFRRVILTTWMGVVLEFLGDDGIFLSDVITLVKWIFDFNSFMLKMLVDQLFDIFCFSYLKRSSALTIKHLNRSLVEKQDLTSSKASRASSQMQCCSSHR